MNFGPKRVFARILVEAKKSFSQSYFLETEKLFGVRFSEIIELETDIKH